MIQVYWLEPIRRRELLSAILGALAGAARVAVEGEPEALQKLSHFVPETARDPHPPFDRQYKHDSAMVVMPLESEREAHDVAALLMPAGRLLPGVEAIQVEKRGSVEFMAGDAFHWQCVSVGDGVPVVLLRDLKRKGIIRGFYSPMEARAHFRLID